MSEYNPCSHCGYDSSAYKALKQSRDELLVIAEGFQGLVNFERCSDELPKQVANLNRAISEAQALKKGESK